MRQIELRTVGMVRGKSGQCCHDKCKWLGVGVCYLFKSSAVVYTALSLDHKGRYLRCERCIYAEVSEPEDY